MKNYRKTFWYYCVIVLIMGLAGTVIKHLWGAPTEGIPLWRLFLGWFLFFLAADVWRTDYPEWPPYLFVRGLWCKKKGSDD